MAIPGVGSATDTSNQYQADATNTATKTSGTALDYDAFLKLLIAQMKNQDPMDPMKSTDYVAQLATFTQVEKAVQTNERMADLLTAARFQQAESLIGRSISNIDGSITGIVESARLSGQDVIAVLKNGQEVTMGTGITVSKGDGA